MPMAITPPPINPVREMYVFCGYCPLNRHTTGCKARGDRVTGYYNNFDQARNKVLRHLTKKKHHGLGQLEAEAILEDNPAALWVQKLPKSKWDRAMRKAHEADQDANRAVSTSRARTDVAAAGDSSRGSTDVAGAVPDKRSRDDRAKQGKRKPRSPSRSPRGIRRSRPRDHGPPPRGRPPPAPFAAANPAASLPPADRFVEEHRDAAVGMWPSRDRNSSPRGVLSEALIRCELALLAAARMARQASVAFDEEATSVGHSKLAFAMDRHKHQSSYVQFI